MPTSSRRSAALQAIGDQWAALVHDRLRLVAITLLAFTIGILVSALVERGTASGSDALAYWHGVRTWLAGGNPYQPRGDWLPWVYAPWLLPLFTPWALLPWAVAWPTWRTATVVLLLLTLRWAYGRRPLATALLVGVLALPVGIALDTGNVVLLCAGAVWLAQFTDSPAGGLLWSLAAATKWFPIVFWPALPPRARRWGIVFAAAAIALSLLTWPWTIQQIADVRATGIPHDTSLPGLRLDHLSIIWGAVPWLWLSAIPWLAEHWQPWSARVRAVSFGDRRGPANKMRG
jgi:hypothetical protein